VDGAFSVRGVPSVRRAFADVASSAWLGWDLPDDEEPGLEARDLHDPTDISYAYASHAVAVAVDLDTARVSLEGYWVAHDSGVLVNPMIVDGQVMGGIAQGIGIGLHERVTFDENAQPTSTTFLDYLVPLSSDVPDIEIVHSEHPAPHIPGGMKGVGEGGTIPTPAAIGNAIAAAVPEIADRVLGTPLSPGDLWALMHGAGLHDS
jgi:carbon-monoxide dehydrogenase large subunit